VSLSEYDRDSYPRRGCKMILFITNFRQLILTIGAIFTLSGCVYGDAYGGYAPDGYISHDSGFSDQYCDPYNEYNAYYGCDVEYGFANIGYGGGWYQDYFYPGHGFFFFDRGGRRHRMNDYYLSYWGSKRHQFFRSRFADKRYSGHKLRRAAFLRQHRKERFERRKDRRAERRDQRIIEERADRRAERRRARIDDGNRADRRFKRRAERRANRQANRRADDVRLDRNENRRANRRDGRRGDRRINNGNNRRKASSRNGRNRNNIDRSSQAIKPQPAREERRSVKRSERGDRSARSSQRRPEQARSKQAPAKTVSSKPVRSKPAKIKRPASRPNRPTFQRNSRNRLPNTHPKN